MKGCSKISISLLSLLVGHSGSATMGLNLRSLGFGLSMYWDFFNFYCVFYLFGLVNFWLSVKVTDYGDIV